MGSRYAVEHGPVSCVLRSGRYIASAVNPYEAELIARALRELHETSTGIGPLCGFAHDAEAPACTHDVRIYQTQDSGERGLCSAGALWLCLNAPEGSRPFAAPKEATADA